MDPLVIALQNIVQTRKLVEELVTSSESFDYRKAKAAIKSLQQMSRSLSKAQAALSNQTPTRQAPTNIQVVDFGNRRASSV
jgi:hypothetical protein